MANFHSGVLSAGVISASLLICPGFGAERPLAVPTLAPDGLTSWVPDRRAGDEFLPPASGPGPVISEKDHPYVPNGGGQSTFRVADLSNPILRPWVVAQMKKANQEVLAGKIPFTARERCWPGGVPDIDVYERDRPVYFIQTPKQVLVVTEHDEQVRHIYLNVPHSRNVTPSWYGESVGHYDGDTLVVDTIGLNDKTFVDNYRTPHTTALHVVERFHLSDERQDFTGRHNRRRSGRLQHAVVGRTALATTRWQSERGIDLRREQCGIFQLRCCANPARRERRFLASQGFVARA